MGGTCNAKFQDRQIVVYKGDPRGETEDGFPVQPGERVRVLSHIHTLDAPLGRLQGGGRTFSGTYYRIDGGWMVWEQCLEPLPPGWDGKQLFTDHLKPAESTLDNVLEKAMAPDPAADIHAGRAVPENEVDRIFNELFGEFALRGKGPKYDVRVFQVPLTGPGRPDMDALMQNFMRLLKKQRRDADEM